MPLFYKLYQDNRSNQPEKGKWFARAKHVGTVDTDMLAEEMQTNCTLKKSDILAVVSELVDVMRTHLQMSQRVKLNGLGAFKLGITTKGAPTVKEFSVAENVRGVHVLFQPETKVEKNKTRVRALVNGCKVKELPKNAVSDEPEGGE